jgi:hypothetical protein
VIKVYDASNITEAHIVRGMLRAHGIEAYVSGHYLQGGVGELATQGFASVLVAEHQAVKARELIETYECGDE